MRYGFTATAAIFLSTASALAGSLPRTEMPARTYGAVKPLPAWVTFCEKQHAECTYGPDEPVRIVLDEATLTRAVTVNAAVNRTVRPVQDEDHWGVADRWDLAEDGRGDCEDYALLKRHRLAAAGVPRRAMRMTVVLNELDEGHAVLTLLTDRGDLILDNRSPRILPWARTGYRFVKREDSDGSGWVALRPIPGTPSEVPVATLAPMGK